MPNDTPFHKKNTIIGRLWGGNCFVIIAAGRDRSIAILQGTGETRGNTFDQEHLSGLVETEPLEKLVNAGDKDLAWVAKRALDRL